MDPLDSPPNEPVSPLIQLYPFSNKLINSIQDGRTSQKERLAIERTLWDEVGKFTQADDRTILMYLIGFYNTIFYQIWAQNTTSACDDHNQFQYQVLTRLGDLNRFMDQSEVAEYYYCNARSLFPQFGYTDKIEPKNGRRKQTRNIALQSILLLHGDRGD